MRGENEGGFTLIELVIVIGIASTLAAVALPRFILVQEDARSAALSRVKGAFSAAIQVVHSKWIAGGTGVAGTVALEGMTLEVNAAGWPYIDTGQISQDTAVKLYEIVMQNPFPTEWTSCETPSAGLLAGEGRFVLSGTGGGAFTYDGATGTIANGGSCP